jgi:hypothetical protein
VNGRRSETTSRALVSAAVCRGGSLVEHSTLGENVWLASAHQSYEVSLPRLININKKAIIK